MVHHFHSKKKNCIDPKARMTAEQALSHPWIVNGSVSNPIDLRSSMEMFNSQRLRNESDVNNDLYN